MDLVAVTKRNLEQHETRSCTTKRRFDLARFALQAIIDNLRRQDQDVSQLAAYHCDVCSGWHMTRQAQNVEWNPNMFAVLRNDDQSIWVRVGGEQWQEYDRRNPPVLPSADPAAVNVLVTEKETIEAPPEAPASSDADLSRGPLSWIPEKFLPVDPIARRFWLLEMLEIESGRKLLSTAAAAKRERGARFTAIHRAIAALPKREKCGNAFKHIAYEMLPPDLFAQLCEATKVLEKQIQDADNVEAGARAAARSYGAAMGWCDAQATEATATAPSVSTNPVMVQSDSSQPTPLCA